LQEGKDIDIMAKKKKEVQKEKEVEREDNRKDIELFARISGLVCV